MFTKIWEYLKIWEHPKVSLDVSRMIQENQLPAYIIASIPWTDKDGNPYILGPEEGFKYCEIPTIYTEDSFELTQESNHKFHSANKGVLVPYGAPFQIQSGFLIYDGSWRPIHTTLTVFGDDSFELADEIYFEKNEPMIKLNPESEWLDMPNGDHEPYDPFKDEE